MDRGGRAGGKIWGKSRSQGPNVSRGTPDAVNSGPPSPRGAPHSPPKGRVATHLQGKKFLSSEPRWNTGLTLSPSFDLHPNPSGPEMGGGTTVSRRPRPFHARRARARAPYPPAPAPARAGARAPPPPGPAARISALLRHGRVPRPPATARGRRGAGLSGPAEKTRRPSPAPRAPRRAPGRPREGRAGPGLPCSALYCSPSRTPSLLQPRLAPVPGGAPAAAPGRPAGAPTPPAPSRRGPGVNRPAL